MRRVTGFRGKSDDSFWSKRLHPELVGKWVYGNLDINAGEEYSISWADGGWYDGPLNTMTNVDPKTIGEFTGKKDREKTRIYELDIVNWVDAENQIEEVMVIQFMDAGCWSGVSEGGDDIILSYFNDSCTVIGNVIDNPQIVPWWKPEEEKIVKFPNKCKCGGDPDVGYDFDVDDGKDVNIFCPVCQKKTGNFYTHEEAVEVWDKELGIK